MTYHNDKHTDAIACHASTTESDRSGRAGERAELEESTKLLLTRVLRAAPCQHSSACCAADKGCSCAACAELHKQACCEPQLRWRLPALALLTIMMLSLLMSEIVTETTSSMVLRKCGNWSG